MINSLLESMAQTKEQTDKLKKDIMKSIPEDTNHAFMDYIKDYKASDKTESRKPKQIYNDLITDFAVGSLVDGFDDFEEADKVLTNGFKNLRPADIQSFLDIKSDADAAAVEDHKPWSKKKLFQKINKAVGHEIFPENDEPIAEIPNQKDGQEKNPPKQKEAKQEVKPTEQPVQQEQPAKPKASITKQQIADACNNLQIPVRSISDEGITFIEEAPNKLMMANRIKAVLCIEELTGLPFNKKNPLYDLKTNSHIRNLSQDTLNSCKGKLNQNCEDLIDQIKESNQDTIDAIILNYANNSAPKPQEQKPNEISGIINNREGAHDKDALVQPTIKTEEPSAEEEHQEPSTEISGLETISIDDEDDGNDDSPVENKTEQQVPATAPSDPFANRIQQPVETPINNPEQNEQPAEQNENTKFLVASGVTNDNIKKLSDAGMIDNAAAMLKNSYINNRLGPKQDDIISNIINNKAVLDTKGKYLLRNSEISKFNQFNQLINDAPNRLGINDDKINTDGLNWNDDNAIKNSIADLVCKHYPMLKNKLSSFMGNTVQRLITDAALWIPIANATESLTEEERNSVLSEKTPNKAQNKLNKIKANKSNDIATITATVFDRAREIQHEHPEISADDALRMAREEAKPHSDPVAPATAPAAPVAPAAPAASAPAASATHVTPAAPVAPATHVTPAAPAHTPTPSRRLSSSTPPVPPSGGSTPPSGGSTPPSGGSTPPAGGSTPPAGGSTPPAGGSTPPAGGSTPPAGGSTPPAGGSTPPVPPVPPSGGSTPPVPPVPPSGGSTPPVPPVPPSGGSTPPVPPVPPSGGSTPPVPPTPPTPPSSPTPPSVRTRFPMVYQLLHNYALTDAQENTAATYADEILDHPGMYPEDYHNLTHTSIETFNVIYRLLDTAAPSLGHRTADTGDTSRITRFTRANTRQVTPGGTVDVPLVYPEGVKVGFDQSIWDKPVITEFGYPFINLSNDAIRNLLHAKDKKAEKREYANLKTSLRQAKLGSKHVHGAIWDAIYKSPLKLLKSFAEDKGLQTRPNMLKVDSAEYLNSPFDGTINVTPIKYYSATPQYEQPVNLTKAFISNFYTFVDYTKADLEAYLRYGDGMSRDDFNEYARNNRGIPPYFILYMPRSLANSFRKSEFKTTSGFGSLLHSLFRTREKDVMVRTTFKGHSGGFIIPNDEANRLFSNVE